jgi:hypothetical protein
VVQASCDHGSECARRFVRCNIQMRAH